MEAAVLTIDDLRPGMSASYSKTFNQADIDEYGKLSGDMNPVHFDPEFARHTVFGGTIAHGMLSAGLISTVLGMKLPGAGCIALGVNLRFRAPVRPGDTVTATCTVKTIDKIKRRVTLDCNCKVKDTVVVEGEALVMAPAGRA